MSWAELFERAADHEVTETEIRDRLTERRNRPAASNDDEAAEER